MESAKIVQIMRIQLKIPLHVKNQFVVIDRWMIGMEHAWIALEMKSLFLGIGASFAPTTSKQTMTMSVECLHVFQREKKLISVEDADCVLIMRCQLKTWPIVPLLIALWMKEFFQMVLAKSVMISWVPLQIQKFVHSQYALTIKKLL